MIFAAIWSGSQSRGRVYWMLVVPTLAVAAEFGQALHIVSGCFDISDLIGCVAASFIAAYFSSRVILYESLHLSSHR